jgi:hypothetical protein
MEEYKGNLLQVSVGLSADDLALASDKSGAVGGVGLGQTEVSGAAGGAFTVSESRVSVAGTESGNGKNGLGVHGGNTSKSRSCAAA